MKLACLFSDHMVVQQKKPIRVWGCGEGRVTVRLGINEATADCQDGRWQVELPPMPAGGPYTMTFTDAAEQVTLTDVMVGEVWLAAGQSNMEHPTFATEGGFEVAETADLPDIRLFTVPRRLYEGQMLHGWHFESVLSEDTPWQVCTPEAALHFSAIGFYFARQLHAAQGVAVGVISCNFGGTNIEPWIAEETLYSDPRCAHVRRLCEERLATLDREAYETQYAEYRRLMDEECRAADGVSSCRALGPYKYNRTDGIKWPAEPALGPKNQKWPGVLYRTMTSRIVPYSLRGVLWYQGESNGGEPAPYFDLFSVYVEQCRRDFRDADLPVFTVQLAPYVCGSPFNWSWLTQQQARAARELPGVYMITSGDLGEVGNIHPIRKQVFAQRLWWAADQALYGGKREYCGPVYAGCTVEGDALRVTFTHAASGLVLGEEPGDFMLCGEDGVFHPATATVEGDTLLVRSEAVPHPVHIRFGCVDQFRLYLYNGAGLPASPFRSDDFDK
ncbi:MAG: hypothetical protein IJ518_03405 [Clostridia bacterium]|nr:hypothetical protein [Clostridia bacterium]